jgi:predicted dithiol-disulfide oxidoreductase (DUF899 family)
MMHIFLFGRDCIFPPRPCEFEPHGAQSRVKDDRYFSGRRMTPKGRDEASLKFPMAWVRRHDQY